MKKILQTIFSIRNEYKDSKKRKVITILGIKIKVGVLEKKPSFIKILLFRLKQKFRKTDKVCYTCITGDYDDLIQHYYINNEWDYICFTDNEELIKKRKVGIWDIKPLEYSDATPHLNNRYHKFFPHKILAEYKESIYVDGNVNVLTPYLKECIKNTNKDLLLPKHFRNNCLYEELSFIVECKKDSKENMSNLERFYKENGFPRNLGFSENNIIYRKHNNKKIQQIMSDWWEMINKFSGRDQASFVYVMWKNGLNINDYTISNARMDTVNFSVISHKEDE